MEIIRSEDDPITSALLKNAHFWFMKKLFDEGKRPVAPCDYAYFMDVLHAMFREHVVLRKILDGERVGAFFEDEVESTPQAELATSNSRDRK